MGYHHAGFNVIGVDVNPQPDYPFLFCQADFNDVDIEGIGPTAVHASPPCQRYSDLAHRNGNAADHPDLVAETRSMLEASGLHYVIENVEGAPLKDPFTLCGTMFPGLRVIRHRLFETNWDAGPLPAHPAKHPLVFTHDKRKAHYGRLDQNESFVQVTGGGNCSVANKRSAMGINWMTGKALNQAIPPAYTEWVGTRLLKQVTP